MELEAKLQKKLEDDIPLARAMSFRVLELPDCGARTRLPLQGNTNHLNTQFGGSLYAAGALSCYTALLAILERGGCPTRNIVIAQGEIDYIAPAEGDCELRVQCPPEEARRFIGEMERKGRARLALEAVISCEGRDVARVRGRYLARSDRPAKIV
jgi:thioesterase domain-containing protein